MDEKQILERNQKISDAVDACEMSNKCKSTEEMRAMCNEAFGGEPWGDTHLLPDDLKPVGQAILDCVEDYKPPQLTEIQIQIIHAGIHAAIRRGVLESQIEMGENNPKGQEHWQDYQNKFYHLKKFKENATANCIIF